MIGAGLTALGWWRDARQRRRKVRLTVHHALHLGLRDVSSGEAEECYFITVTNASPERDIVVTHVWLETEPPVHVHDEGLPVRLPYSQPWETFVPVRQVPPTG